MCALSDDEEDDYEDDVCSRGIAKKNLTTANRMKKLEGKLEKSVSAYLGELSSDANIASKRKNTLPLLQDGHQSTDKIAPASHNRLSVDLLVSQVCMSLFLHLCVSVGIDGNLYHPNLGLTPTKHSPYSFYIHTVRSPRQRVHLTADRL